jgi:hypothetical protein
LKILLGNFKKSEELISFLEPRVGTKPTLNGGEMEIDDSSVKKGLKPRHVKTYIKRFLHKVGERKSFRVLVQGKELRLVQLEGVEEKEEKTQRVEEKKEPEKIEVKEPQKEESKEQEERKEPKRRQKKSTKKEG